MDESTMLDYDTFLSTLGDAPRGGGMDAMRLAYEHLQSLLASAAQTIPTILKHRNAPKPTTSNTAGRNGCHDKDRGVCGFVVSVVALTMEMTRVDSFVSLACADVALSITMAGLCTAILAAVLEA